MYGQQHPLGSDTHRNAVSGPKMLTESIARCSGSRWQLQDARRRRVANAGIDTRVRRVDDRFVRFRFDNGPRTATGTAITGTWGWRANSKTSIKTGDR